jgi:hypothetical protein
MRRGQTTLEYILFIGIAAAGLITMIFYVSRGHQGYLRSQADQLSQEQYAPGETEIDNHENKNLISTVNASSTTTTTHSKNPVGQRNEALEGPIPNPDDPGPPIQGILALINKAKMNLYFLYSEWEDNIVIESIGPDAGVVSGQAAKVKNGLWPWPGQPTAIGSIDYEENELINSALCGLTGQGFNGGACPCGSCPDNLSARLAAAKAAWHTRDPDTSTSGSSSKEKGSIETTKPINESLGAL